MIYTVTLNPSLDYVMETKLSVLGGLNRSEKEHIYPGGKGINVALVLNALDCEAVALGFVSGDTGTLLEQLLTKYACHTDFIRLPHMHTRINVKWITDGSVTEINGAGLTAAESDLAQLEQRLHRLGEGDTVVFSGKLPNGAPEDTYCQLWDALDQTVRVVIDTEGQALRLTLARHPYLIKPNRAEVEALFNVTINSHADAARCAKILQAEGAQHVLVSLGAEGAVLAAGNETFFCPAVPGVPVNPTGAGDAMLAGFLAAAAHGKAMEAALHAAVEVGSRTAFCAWLPI